MSDDEQFQQFKLEKATKIATKEDGTIEFCILNFDNEYNEARYMFVEDYEKEYHRNTIIEPDVIIIPDSEILIEFRYPLSKTVHFPYKKEGGFTRKDIFQHIYEGYKKIYDEEEKAVGDPGTYERLYNRKRSSGPYGIWGHYLSDLTLAFLEYDPKTKILSFGIDS